MNKILCIGRMYADFWEMSSQYDISVDWLNNVYRVIIPFPYNGLLYYDNHEYNLNNYDAVCLFGNSIICRYLYDLLSPHKLVIGNPYTRNMMCDKVISAIVMSNNGIPVIPSYYSLSSIGNNITSEVFDTVVTKPKGGSFGKNVVKHKNFKICTNMIAQKYIECNSSDERWIIVDGKLIMIVKRTSQDKDEFRANITLGAKTELLEITEEKRNLALKIYNTFPGCVWTGADVLYDTDSNPYVCEVNYFPHLESDPQFYTKISGHNFYDDIYEYILKEIENYKTTHTENLDM